MADPASPTPTGADPKGRDRRTVQTMVVAVAADAVLTAAKLLGWVLTGSSSLLAEALHSAAETGNQALLFVGRRRARDPEDRTHPFGSSREQYFWPLIVSVLMFVIGAIGALVEGVRKLLDPAPVERPAIAFAVLGLALLLDGGSWLNAVRQARPDKGGRGWWAYVRESRRPEIPVILMQDTAAVLGLGIAALGVGGAVVADAPAADAIGSFGIAVLLGAVALVLAREMRSLLIGEAALPEERELVLTAIAAHPEVDEVVSLRTLHLGPDDLLVEAKVRFDDDLRVDEVARSIDEIEHRIRAELPHARIIAIEPDLPEPGDPERTAWRP